MGQREVYQRRIADGRRRVVARVAHEVHGIDLDGDMRDLCLGVAEAVRAEAVRQHGTLEQACARLQSGSGVAASHWRVVLCGGADIDWLAVALRLLGYRMGVVAEPVEAGRVPDLTRGESQRAQRAGREIRRRVFGRRLRDAHIEAREVAEQPE